MSPERRTALTVVGIAVALGGVAVAAKGGVSTGTGGASRPSEWVIDVAVSLLLVVLALGSVLAGVVLALRPSVLLDTAAPVRRRGKLVAVLVVAALVVLALLAARRLASDGGLRSGLSGFFAGEGGDDPLRDGSEPYEPSFATVPVVVICALALIAVAAWLLARRARRAAEPPATSIEEAVAGLLDDTLDDLRSEPDARRAVIAAYARLEVVLAAHGAARHPAEAADEYLRRVLASLELSREAVSRLTGLFQTAKFSHHDVDLDMKNSAIDALVSARDELRQTRERIRAERAAAASAGQRAATR